MILFWTLAAVLAAIALLFATLPLLRSRQSPGDAPAANELNLSVYRTQLDELIEDSHAGSLDDEHYAQARGELENRLIEEMPEADGPPPAPVRASHRGAAFATIIVVPLLSFLLYTGLGSPEAVVPRQTDDPHGMGQQQMDAMIQRLAARLDKNPQDAKGWIMLARAQAVVGRVDDARATYARSVALFPDDAQLLADYADALATAQGGSLQGAPEELVERALRSDPDNTKALALAGTAAFEHKNFGLAVKHWQRLRDLFPRGSEFAKAIQGSIDEAKNLSAATGGKREMSSATGNRPRPVAE